MSAEDGSSNCKGEALVLHLPSTQPLSGKVNLPGPFLLLATYAPSYTAPLLHVYLPLPSRLPSTMLPSYMSPGFSSSSSPGVGGTYFITP
jgi:hypothetical protein